MEITMQCICGEYGVRAAEERRLRVFERLGVARMNDLLTAVVFSLAFDFGCTAGILADQWFGVSVRSSLDTEGIFVPCDAVSDGLLAAWENLAGRYPERVTTNPARSSGSVTIARVVSGVLIAQYGAVERAHREHRRAAHKDDNDCPPCVDCEVGMTLRSIAMASLGIAWGERVLDPAIEKAFDD
jgi:hypothetical protein